MEWIDQLILEPSLQQLELSRLILLATFLLYIPFLAILLGGALLSFITNGIGRVKKSARWINFSWELIDRLSVNVGVGLLWGLLPLVTIIILSAHLFYTAKTAVVFFQLEAAALVFFGLVLLTIYRHTFRMDALLQSVRTLSSKIGPASEALVEHEFEHYHATHYKTGFYASLFGVLSLAGGIFIFIGSLELAIRPNLWSNVNSLFQLMTIGGVWLSFALFGALSILSSAAVLLFFESGKIDTASIDDKSYLEFVRQKLLIMAFLAAILVPALIAGYAYITPDGALSFSLLLGWTVIVFAIFSLAHFLYNMIRTPARSLVGWLLLTLSVAWISLVVGQYVAIDFATKSHSEKLTAKALEIYRIRQEKAGVAPEAVSGEEVFKRICSSCHSFENRIVGPAFNSVLPKYKGNKDALKAFIANPTKQNPDFPPMPNLGLKPAEVEAVAHYLLNQK